MRLKVLLGVPFPPDEHRGKAFPAFKAFTHAQLITRLYVALAGKAWVPRLILRKPIRAIPSWPIFPSFHRGLPSYHSSILPSFHPSILLFFLQLLSPRVATCRSVEYYIVEEWSLLLAQKGMMALAPFLLVLLVQKGMTALDTLTKV